MELFVIWQKVSFGWGRTAIAADDCGAAAPQPIWRAVRICVLSGNYWDVSAVKQPELTLRTVQKVCKTLRVSLTIYGKKYTRPVDY